MRAAVVLLICLTPGIGAAQSMADMPGMKPTPPEAPVSTPDSMPDMPGMPGMKAPVSQTPASDPKAEKERPDPDSMANMPGMTMGSMRGDLGDYSMMRDASGTAWQPDSSPMEGVHGHIGSWATMLHGNIALVYDDQGGPRGGDKTFSESMLMGMAQRPLNGGVLTLRAMGSLDAIMGKAGYPLLLQTGETANGKSELIDRQHPHDLFMELAAAYSHPLAGGVSGFVYFGYPGEPALGPVTFMHRFSGAQSPEAPIGHHWLDSTHVTFGVVTGGLVYDRFKLEVSRFTGREPNQNRYDFDPPRFDSWSVRGSWNPTANLSLQVSYGHLHSPEQLTPLTDQNRTTASATYNRPFAFGDWQTTLAWGRDADSPGRTTDAYLLESALAKGPHTIFGRAETVAKDDLFADTPASPLAGRAFQVTKVSLGYAYTVGLSPHLAVDLGGLASRYGLPSALRESYGGEPTSFMLFMRFKLR